MSGASSHHLAWVLGVALALVGCGSCDRQSERTEGVPEADEKATPEGERLALGTVTGVVRLAEGAELPELTLEDIVENPKLKVERPDVCPAPTEADRRPVERVDGRALQGVLVSAADFSASPSHDPTEHAVTIRDCQLEPQLVVGMRGDQLVVRNETEYPFLPRVGGDPFMQALTKGQEREVPLDQGGIYPIRCGMGAPCGRAELIVIYHPVYDVTGKDGRFQIANVPAGEKLTIHAWHPLFEESVVEVTVPAGETKEIELVIAPKKPDGEDGGADEAAEPDREDGSGGGPAGGGAEPKGGGTGDEGGG